MVPDTFFSEKNPLFKEERNRGTVFTYGGGFSFAFSWGIFAKS